MMISIGTSLALRNGASSASASLLELWKLNSMLMRGVTDSTGFEPGLLSLGNRIDEIFFLMLRTGSFYEITVDENRQLPGSSRDVGNPHKRNTSLLDSIKVAFASLAD